MNIGKRIHIAPLRSAMHWALEIRTERWGFICMKPPTYVFGRWWPWYFYISPNATPWAATLLWGHKGEVTCDDRMLAKVRRALWGHGYSTEEHDPQSIRAYTKSLAWVLPEDDEEASRDE